MLKEWSGSQEHWASPRNTVALPSRQLLGWAQEALMIALATSQGLNTLNAKYPVQVAALI